MTNPDNTSQTPAPQRQTSSSLVTLDIREKEICFVLPVDASSIGGTLNLPGGAFIQGHFTGTLICARGALVIGPGASFSGYAEAEEVYIAGEIGRTKGSNKSTSIMGRSLIAISESAVVHADLTSRMFNMNNNKNVFGTIRTLV
jgi:hypothetical protein